ncbi:MAG TPA: sodium transporter, partial [Candidatus Omnitrophota bacterium]|nr:sodium transporter [Candidatus Omnitrophota bacterium]
SYFAARQEFYIIVTLMSLSWGAIAGAFMAPYVYGLFWKRGTLLGAKAGMVSGLATSVILFFVLGSARAPMAASIAMIVPFIVMPIVSVCTKPPEAHVIHKAFKGI